MKCYTYKKGAGGGQSSHAEGGGVQHVLGSFLRSSLKV